MAQYDVSILFCNFANSIATVSLVILTAENKDIYCTCSGVYLSITVVDVVCMHAPHLLCLSVAMVCKMLLNALLYRQPHALCPALMEQFTFPQVQCASVSKVVIQILYWHTHKRKWFWGNRKIQVWKATKNITFMNPASVSSSGCIIASTSCCSECNCSCGWTDSEWSECATFI